MKRDDTKCLNEFEMGAYVENSLSPDMREEVENHFASCNQCWSEFIAVHRAMISERDVLTGEAPGHLIKEAVAMFPEKSRLSDIVLKLVRDSVDVVFHAHDITLFTPLPASGLRSGKSVRPEMVVLKKSFREMDVQLDIEKVSETICNIRVAVDKGTGKNVLKGLRAELVAAGRVLDSEPLEAGEMVLEDIGTGRYAIRISKKGKVVGEISLKLE
jgi:hypothetical protein